MMLPRAVLASTLRALSVAGPAFAMAITAGGSTAQSHLFNLPAPQGAYSCAGAGDVDGDGVPDVIVGSDANGRGSATVYSGRWGTVLRQWTGTQDANLGLSVSGAGDVDRDGYDDVGIAAPGNPGFEDKVTRGRADVVLGAAPRARSRVARLGRRGFRIGFGTSGELTGISAAGDWNRDGRPDVVIADCSALRGASAIWIVYRRRRQGAVNLARLGRRGLVIRGRTTFQ
jgi:hypothetical protein